MDAWAIPPFFTLFLKSAALTEKCAKLASIEDSKSLPDS